MTPASENGNSATRGKKSRNIKISNKKSLMNSASKKIKSMSYLSKWLILASIIGIIAGLGAVLFYEALSLATHFFLTYLAGYKIPTPAGEGNFAGSAHYARPWAIPLVVVLGGLLSGFIVFTWAPEAEGHGTDAAIDAIHHNPRKIRLRAVVVKIIASALTIGSGGSGGREGPTAQISAGFGSLLARVLDLSPEDGRIAVSVGIGSGIGAIFSAPLGGAVLAADIVYRDDFAFEALLPGTLASIIAYAIFGGVYGYQPLFHIPGNISFNQPIQLLWFALLGLVAGGVGLLYSKSFYGIVDLSKRLPFTKKLRPAVGAVFTGLLALWMPEVLGTGYGWVQKGLSSELSHLPLYIIFLLPFARIAATSFSIGTGGSGGVFGPGMVIGSFTGLAFWDLLKPLVPGVGHDPVAFIVVGMMAVFGSISRAPIAVMLMVAEMTGNISLLGPAMIAVAIAWFITSHTDDSIYRSQLRSKADSPARQLSFGLPLLTSLEVKNVINPAVLTLKSSQKGGEALSSLDAKSLPGAPVVDSDNKLLGTIRVDRLKEVLETNPEAVVSDAIDSSHTSLQVSSKLDEGLELLLQSAMTWVPVVDHNNDLQGILSFSDLVKGYNKVLDSKAGYVYDITPRAFAMEQRVMPGSRVVGKKVRDAGLPSGCVVIWIQHEGVRTFATGATEIDEGDVINTIISADQADELRALLHGNGTK